MTLINRIKRAVCLDEKVYSEIADDKDALVQAIIVMYLATVISTLGNEKVRSIVFSLEFYPVLIFVVLMLILALLTWLIITGIMHIPAKLLGGKADFVSYLKTIGFAEAPVALGVIPFIDKFIGFIWCLICCFTATKVVHGLSTGKAMVVVITPIIMAIIIGLLIGVIRGIIYSV